MDELDFSQIVCSLVKTTCRKLDRRLKDLAFRQDSTMLLSKL